MCGWKYRAEAGNAGTQSTDIVNKANLIAAIHYDYENKLHEDSSFC